MHVRQSEQLECHSHTPEPARFTHLVDEQEDEALLVVHHLADVGEQTVNQLTGLGEPAAARESSDGRKKERKEAGGDNGISAHSIRSSPRLRHERGRHRERETHHTKPRDE